MCIVVMHIHQSAVLCHHQARCLLSMAEMSPDIFLLLRSEELHSGSSCSDDEYMDDDPDYTMHRV